MRYRKFDILSDWVYSYNYRIERLSKQSFDGGLRILWKRVFNVFFRLFCPTLHGLTWLLYFTVELLQK